MTKNTTPTADNIQPGQVDSINAADMAQESNAQQDERKAADIAINKARTKRKTTTSSEVKRRYDANAYDRLSVNVIKGDKEKLKAAAANAGLSVNAVIIAAINAYFDEDILTPMAINPYI